VASMLQVGGKVIFRRLLRRPACGRTPRNDRIDKSVIASDIDEIEGSEAISALL